MRIRTKEDLVIGMQKYRKARQNNSDRVKRSSRRLELESILSPHDRQHPPRPGRSDPAPRPGTRGDQEDDREADGQ